MKSQTGMNLIEVMIASVIGVFLITGMMNLFITTNKSISLSDGISQNQETGRFAMDYLTKFVRLAGYSSDSSNRSPYISIASDGIDCALADICAVDNLASIRGDRLALPFSTAQNEIIRSCTGSNVGDPATPLKYVNIFWVSLEEKDNSGNIISDRELRCRTYNLTFNTWADNAVSILSNIEQLHFQVGLASGETVKQASRYVSVDQVTDIRLVRSIRVGILATSLDSIDENKLKTTVEERRYSVLDGPVFTPTDGNFRHIFTSTIELPNAIEAAR